MSVEELGTEEVDVWISSSGGTRSLVVVVGDGVLFLSSTGLSLDGELEN